MKTFLIAIFLSSLSAVGQFNFFKGDSMSERPGLIIKTSALSLLNWRTPTSYLDIGAEFRLYDSFTLDGDIGRYYRPFWGSNQEYTRGYFSDVSLRWYPKSWEETYYFGLQYRYQKKKAVIEADFSDAGLPYTKLIDVDRNSNFVYALFGHSRKVLIDRLYIDWSIGLGVEHRVGVLSGVADFEQEAIESGQVDGTKYDEEAGRFLPAYYYEIKIGFSLF
ncbi:MAG: DUF3575 domain-containing protein [Flavobacteriales bacterium]|nr:DUF3575 domain-containing protein [Flavobacteriales bacterium]